MTKSNNLYILSFIFLVMSLISCINKVKKESNNLEKTNVWEIDFLDEFDSFNPENWQDQRIWVNDEKHCYVPDNEFGTREVSDGTLKIKVVKIDGYQATLADFIIRWIFRIVDLNIMSGVVALIAIITSPKNQRLGDMTAGTAVITLKNNVNINHTILEDLKQDYMPSYPSVIRLSDNDARIIKDTFKTAKKSKDFKTLIKLRTKIVEVLELKEIKHSTDHEFIDVILKDYNYYTQNM